MAYKFPDGAKFLFSKTFGTAKTVSAITNADPAVATAATHGLTEGDEFLLNSGWEDAGDSVYLAGTVADANTLEVDGLDSSDTGWFSAGAGVGSVQAISDWKEIPQVLTIATSGGDARNATIAPLSRRNSFNVPLGFNPTVVTLTLGHDSQNAIFKEMLGVSRTLTKVAFKLLLTGGETSYGYGYMAVSELPAMNSGAPNQVTAVFSFIGRATSY